MFCNIGKALGAKRILDQARKFGFYERPPLETPESERYPSGLYRQGDLWYPERNSDVDAGRMAFGQERMLVTPLQMAMVAAGIGNAGIVMRPTSSRSSSRRRARRSSGRSPSGSTAPSAPVDARDISNMMVRAVEAGTGTAAQMSGLPGRGEDGHRGDGCRLAEHDLVHRVRGTARPAAGGRDRRRPRGPELHRRLDRRPDRRAS